MRPSHFVKYLAIAFFQYFATTPTALCKVRRVLLRMLQRILLKNVRLSVVTKRDSRSQSVTDILDI